MEGRAGLVQQRTLARERHAASQFDQGTATNIGEDAATGSTRSTAGRRECQVARGQASANRADARTGSGKASVTRMGGTPSDRAGGAWTWRDSVDRAGMDGGDAQPLPAVDCSDSSAGASFAGPSTNSESADMIRGCKIVERRATTRARFDVGSMPREVNELRARNIRGVGQLIVALPSA
jgi:hypothetical protein